MTTHTKSTSGKTHRLSYNGRHVTTRYREIPAFDDRVQGDLWRKFQREIQLWCPFPSVGVATVDAALGLTAFDLELDNPSQLGR